ncbi:MAG TPA: Nramp family divalent metal transporter [archaeon]|nr:Nramp family divalent metal transporter [archaeon]
MDNERYEVKIPPRGLAILALVGPGLIWAGEYIGSGEVILCTRLGSILGFSILWVPLMAIFLKYWIGLSGARYTVCVGEGMIDMFSRMPGPKNWAVWVVLVGQFSAGAVSIGGLAVAAAAFINALCPVNQAVLGWIVSIFCVSVVWSGKFEPLKYISSALVLVMVVGVIYVAGKVVPGVRELVVGLFGFNLPEVPAWAISSGAAGPNVWAEILPVLGWAAGGFASQVWYSYWVLESGFSKAGGGAFGKAADRKALGQMTAETARRLKGWCRVVYTDATTALTVGTAVTLSFMIAGAGVLGKLHLAPNGPQVAIQLSELFGQFWGRTGAVLFLLAGCAAMVSTNLCQFAGWPRIMSDCTRILFPSSEKKFSPQSTRRFFVLVFLVSNMLIINTFGFQPVMLIKTGAILDGLLLNPMQAILIGVALFIIMPRLLSREAARILKPNLLFAIGLAIAALVFGYFSVVKVPTIF